MSRTTSTRKSEKRSGQGGEWRHYIGSFEDVSLSLRLTANDHSEGKATNACSIEVKLGIQYFQVASAIFLPNSVVLACRKQNLLVILPHLYKSSTKSRSESVNHGI